MKKLEIRHTTQEERREETEAMLAASEVRKAKEKSQYHQSINDEVRKRLSPSDEIAILRHAVVILADVLIQAKVLKESDVEELLQWNETVTKIKAKAKSEIKEENVHE